jgi:hypothetical protein
VLYVFVSCRGLGGNKTACTFEMKPSSCQNCGLPSTLGSAETTVLLFYFMLGREVWFAVCRSRAFATLLGGQPGTCFTQEEALAHMAYANLEGKQRLASSTEGQIGASETAGLLGGAFCSDVANCFHTGDHHRLEA